jgi:hypothetical protein
MNDLTLKTWHHILLLFWNHIWKKFIFFKEKCPAENWCLFFLLRYDLLCLEGLAQALRVFLELQEIPTYKLAGISKDAMFKIHVKPEVVMLWIHNFLVPAFLKWNMNSFFCLIADISDSSLCCMCCIKRFNFWSSKIQQLYWSTRQAAPKYLSVMWFESPPYLF